MLAGADNIVGSTGVDFDGFVYLVGRSEVLLLVCGAGDFAVVGFGTGGGGCGRARDGGLSGLGLTIGL